MAYKYPFSILLALILYSVAQTQASPSVDDLYYSIKASRDEIVSGSMTYLYSEEDYGGPNISVNSDMDPEESAYLLARRTQEALCSFEFKRQGGLMLWRLSVKNQADNRDCPSDIVQRFNLDYRFIHTFDGETYFRLSYPVASAPELHISAGEIPIGFGKDLLATSGVPWCFQSDERFAYLKDGVHEYTLSESENNCINLKIMREGVRIQSSTLSLENDGLCVDQANYKLLRNPHSGVFFAYDKPDIEQFFSEYRQSGGIWYPSEILETQSYLSIEDDSNGPIMRIIPTSKITINILSCDFNIPLEDSLFSLRPGNKTHVYDHRYNVEYVEQN